MGHRLTTTRHSQVASGSLRRLHFCHIPAGCPFPLLPCCARAQRTNQPLFTLIEPLNQQNIWLQKPRRTPAIAKPHPPSSCNYIFAVACVLCPIQDLFCVERARKCFIFCAHSSTLSAPNLASPLLSCPPCLSLPATRRSRLPLCSRVWCLLTFFRTPWPGYPRSTALDRTSSTAFNLQSRRTPPLTFAPKQLNS